MTFRLSTAANLLHRPHLITPQAAEYWAGRLREMDPRAFRRPSRFDALTRRLGLGRDRPLAWDDDGDGESTTPPTRPIAYAPMWMGEPDKQLDWGWSIKDGIAMMEISGPLVERGGWGWCDFMHGYDTIAAAIDQADADTSVKAMLIRFDTPGGVVASGIYDLSAKLQARAADAKPLWAICEMACSAGYWICSQFDNVIATQAGLAGSIGVIMAHENHAGALEKFGVEITTIEAPEGGFKSDGAWWKAMSEQGKANLQSDINELFVQFLATVEAGRGDKLTAEKARALGAQVFPATHSDKTRDAVALGLVDAVMSEQQAFEALKAQVAAPQPFQQIPAPAGAVAAEAAQPTKETDMALRADVRAALAKADAKRKTAGGKPDAKSDSETLDEIRKLVNESDEEPEAEGEDGEDGEDEAPAADGETDEEKEAKARAAAAKPSAMIDAKVAQAVLNLPEAKGREALAQRLAFKPGMTVEEAKADLAAAPKASRMADRVTDPKLSADVPADTRTDAQKEVAAAIVNAGIRPVR